MLRAHQLRLYAATGALPCARWSRRRRAVAGLAGGRGLLVIGGISPRPVTGPGVFLNIGETGGSSPRCFAHHRCMDMAGSLNGSDGLDISTTNIARTASPVARRERCGFSPARGPSNGFFGHNLSGAASPETTVTLMTWSFRPVYIGRYTK
ncbi:hypothetical protein GGR56DRAFT_635242 [Xylariaceae sp. FL0804]|nr:hypothetical protein GGR56DRAFT_635242 [Xylariaceae sp. FL0804]